ncbi:hypothetical protein HID58_014983 [Brassica napus]|uniref:Uncharacterized protein n=2 Tax=Brassica TaxID=3705 RepID=A0ABQ8DL85_BRANA|nr:hypothetical protein HID58_014983 [Brassica napus]
MKSYSFKVDVMEEVVAIMVVHNKVEVGMLVERIRWKRGYGGAPNCYSGHAVGPVEVRSYGGGEGGRAGGGAVEVDQKSG